jgi:hypothetical protein
LLREIAMMMPFPSYWLWQASGPTHKESES